MILYRPIGLIELRLIYESGLKTFPPRLPEQPIFYPVLNIVYARQIAFAWNTKSEPFAGYVTEFEIDDNYITQFDQHIVGGVQHAELWIPSEKLDEFNQHIIGQLKIVDAFFGEKYHGFIGKSTNLKDKDANEQFILISKAYEYSPMDVHIEIIVNKEAIFLNYPFWQKHDFTNEGFTEDQRKKTLDAIKKSWTLSFPDVPLGIV